VDVGSYADFGTFRETVASVLENGVWGSRFPTLMFHSDCDGEWNPDDSGMLAKELEAIVVEFKKRPPTEFAAEWQRKVAKQVGLRPVCLYDCFIDVDGEPLLDRLVNMAKLALHRDLPILFQ
jgi:hypothetical protein